MFDMYSLDSLTIALHITLTCNLSHRAKHPTKVLVWAGISWQGPTGIRIFEEKINTPLFISIHNVTLKPFISAVYPAGLRLMQDNDPSRCRRQYKLVGDTL